MTWLVVLGNGSWTTDGVTYKAGKHEIDDATTERARKAIKRRYPLQLSEVEPEIIRDEDAVKEGKPLMASEVRYPRKRGVAVKLEAAPQPQAADAPPPSESIPGEFPCDQCVETFPTADSLLTHIEFDHLGEDEDVAQEPEDDAPSEPWLGKAAAFAKEEGEPIPWPEAEPEGPTIHMPVTGAEETVIHDVPVSQGAPPIDPPL